MDSMSLRATAGRVVPCSFGRIETKGAKQSHNFMQVISHWLVEIASGFALAMTEERKYLCLF
jgi:hypothetical protein